MIICGQSKGSVANRSIDRFFIENIKRSFPESQTLRQTDLKVDNAVNFSCLDLVNYWSQLFNENFLKPMSSFRMISTPFGGLSQIYIFLVSILNLFQMTLNDLRSHTSSVHCIEEQYSICRIIDESFLSIFPSNGLYKTMLSQTNFYLGSNHNFHPLFAIWNTGFLSYKCFCKTC